MELFLFWLMAAVVCSIIASTKGRSAFGFFIYGFLLAPIAFIHVIFASPGHRHAEKQALSDGGRKCPRCAEIIKQEALVCRFCGLDIPQPTRHSGT